MNTARNTAQSVATQTGSDKYLINGSVRPVAQLPTGVQPLRVPVRQQYGSATYQHLYQKGFRAGRRYERERYELQLSEQNADLESMRNRLDYQLEANYRVSLERVRVLSDLHDRRREVNFLRWMLFGCLLATCLVSYLAGWIG